MHKAKSVRRIYTEKVLDAWGGAAGEQVLKDLMMRSLKKAQAHRLNHLISGYIGNSVYVVTHRYGDGGVKQRACLPEELTEADRAVMRTGTFRRDGRAAILLEPDGRVADATGD